MSEEKVTYDFRTQVIQSIILQNRQRNKINYYVGLSSVEKHVNSRAVFLRRTVDKKLYFGFYDTYKRIIYSNDF